ncbi:MAG TPA: TolC family protein [Candidatus Ozemobacteraceae bacterium]|nr:TolC family protein [Candidatus Ozemobacteraceae bacterium]
MKLARRGTMCLLLFFSMATAARALDLAGLLEDASRRNLGLRISRLAAEEQAFDEKRADNLLVPNLTGRITHQRQVYVDSTPSAFFGAQYHANLLSLQAAQAYPGLGKMPAIQKEIAELRTRLRRIDVERAASMLRGRIVTLFFDLLEEQQLAQVDEINLFLLGKLLEVARINQEVGLALPNDILRIETQRANIGSSLTSRKAQQERYRLELAYLLDYPPASLTVDLPPSIVFPLASPSLSLFEQAMMTSDPDLELARRDADLYRRLRSAAGLAEKPTISVGGAYNFTNSSVGTVNVARDYSVQVAVDFPVFDGGDLKNESRRASKAVDRADLALADITGSKQTALLQAMTEYGEMAPKLEFAVKALEQSRENMRMVMTRYQHGDATIVELIDAQITMSEAAQNSVRIHRDERVRLAALYELSHELDLQKGLDRGAWAGRVLELPEGIELDDAASALSTPDAGRIAEAFRSALERVRMGIRFDEGLPGVISSLSDLAAMLERLGGTSRME